MQESSPRAAGLPMLSSREEQEHMTEYADLIDTTLVDAAKLRFDEIFARLSPAREDLAAAKTASDAAKIASDAALRGEGDADPHEAQATLDAAGKRLDVEQRHVAAIEASVTEAHDGIRIATGKAHQPLYVAGIVARLDACRLADAARARLVEALAALKAGTEMMRYAARNGSGHCGPEMTIDSSSPSLTGPDGKWAQPTGEEEASRWRGPRGFWPGLDEVGNVRGND